MSRRALAAGLLLALALAGAGPALASVVYLAFGDSITFGTGDLDPDKPDGYPRRLQKLLRQAGVDDELMVENHGLAGEKTGEALSRYASVLARGGDAFLLMEGTNDISLVEEGMLSIETVVANLDTMARRARNLGIEPVHATIFPRQPKARHDGSNVLTLTLNWEIRDLAIRTGRKLADVWEAFDVAADPDVFLTMFAKLTGDTVGHPNASAYDRMAAVFADVLQEIDSVPPVAAHYIPGLLTPVIKPSQEIEITLFEPKDGAGIQLKRTWLLINGREVAEPTGASSRRRAVLQLEDKKAIGCRAAIGVRSEDRSDPPNAIDRLLIVYDVEGRSVLVGDVDFDCRVDGFDVVALGVRFGATREDARYSTIYDFNGDGIVDGEDLARLAENFGKRSD